jgi:hypothetical protein
MAGGAAVGAAARWFITEAFTCRIVRCIEEAIAGDITESHDQRLITAGQAPCPRILVATGPALFRRTLPEVGPVLFLRTPAVAAKRGGTATVRGPEMQSGPLRRTAATGSVPRPAQIRELSRDTTRAAMCAPRLIGDEPALAVRLRALAPRRHAIPPPAPRPPGRSKWHCGRLVNGRTVARRQR